MNFINLLRILYIIAKQQILTHCDQFKLPKRLQILGKILALIFCPTKLFTKPQVDFAKRFTQCLEELGPIYIKFGQTLATRPDLVGGHVAEQLQYLQDRLPPFSTEIVEEIIANNFGKTCQELFKSFITEPVAAASISQVHKAELKNGNFVAVKVIRPDIYKRYIADIKLLYFLAKWVSKLNPKVRRLKLIEVVNVFETMMKQELDLRLEAAAASEIYDNFKQNPDVVIPRVYWELTAKNVLTISWIDGVSVYNIDALKSFNLDLQEIASKIAVMFFNQAYRDGFFHADLHHGNVLVTNKGQIALIDFGIMGRLVEKDRLAIAEILLAFLNKDYKNVALIHKRIGYIPPDTNLELFAQACRAVCEPIIGLPIKSISIADLLKQLFDITEEFSMRTQPQLLLLQKTMVVVEGIGQSLDPEINMWTLAEPWIKKWAIKNISPEAKIVRALKNFVEKFLY